jgi:hypothetical protein
VPERTAEQVQQDIEKARDELAVTIDQLAARTNPKRLADEAKQTLAQKAQSPAGKAVLGGVAVLVVLLVVRRIGKSRKND